MSLLTSFSGNLKSFTPILKKFIGASNEDVITTLVNLKSKILDEVLSFLHERHGVKWYIAVTVDFHKFVNDEELTQQPTFHSKTRTLLPSNDVSEQYNEAVGFILENISLFVRDGSGWIFDKVVNIDLHMVRYKPLYGSSFIPTPKRLENTKAVVNIKNNDHKCFLWSVLAGIHPYPLKHYHYRVSFLSKYEKLINMEGIEYPVKITDINKFEKSNSSISINLFGYEKDQKHEEIFPLRITVHKNRKNHVNLLMLTNEQGNTHYCLVKDLSRLLSYSTKHNGKKFYCIFCLHRFSNKSLLDKHEPICAPYGVQKTRLPYGNEKWEYFKNYTLSNKVPFTIYADFESFLEPIHTCDFNPSTSHSNNVAKHVPSGFCYVIINRKGKAIKPPVVYNKDNVVDTFLKMLMKEAKKLMRKINTHAPLIYNTNEEVCFKSSKMCHLCRKPFIDDEVKVRNHDHLDGKYLGAAHGSCNMNFKVPSHIPVFFHNLKGYDSHHLMSGLGKFASEKVSCLATSSERYISFSLGSLRFLDSLQFLNTSLDSLVKNLAVNGKDDFKILNQCKGDENLDLLLCKGVYPYEYMTDKSKFTDTSLPSKEYFYNTLTESLISEDDYKRAQKIWHTFKMKNMGDYHNLYLETDTLLLADVFERFRKVSIDNYDIDPCNVYSAPGLAWNAMLKMTGIKLELVTDIEQHLMWESSIRGGNAVIPHRFAKANNRYLPNYDPSLPSSYLIFFDCTNLYGTSMKEFLPYSDFKMMTKEEFNKIDFEKVEDNSDIGYILEIDLTYPKELHEVHNQYPLAPLKQVVTEEMLSPYSKKLLSQLGMPITETEKLLTTLEDKKKYVLHYRNLKFYLKMGLELKKIHRVLSFRQSAWLTPFIDFNTEKRKQALNVFEKDFFKLMNNATYGKSLENVRSRIDFKLVVNEKDLLKWAASPRLKRFIPYDENLAGLALKQQCILLNRPLYIGFSVLDISKLLMYKFHYEWAVEKYGSKVKLCMTDTDSLLYFVETDDIYADIKDDLHLFDTSDYPNTHDCYSLKNKKKLGTFKDEMNGKPIREYCGLRAKCYSVLDFHQNEKNVAKGVPRVAIKKQLKHEEYKKCLFNQEQKSTQSCTIRSDKHQLFTRKISKLSLTPYDNKRYILEDGVSTFAYGHHKIMKKKLKKKLNKYKDNEEPVCKKKVPSSSVSPSTSAN